VRFRAPASIELAAVALPWERPGADCTLDLHADAAGAPAALLARTDIRATSSWTTTSLSAALVAGEIYHLVVRCGATAGRLAYVLDHAPAAASQSWQLEDLRQRRVRTHEHASGAPLGAFCCLDPASGFARRPSGAPGCPDLGMLYGRDFKRGKVLTNPTSTAETVSLGDTYVCDGTPRRSVTLSPTSGIVCSR
jgi:hypothetical protein